jgi:hypothetical protein
MRNIALAFLLCLYYSPIANAREIIQLNKPVVCSDLKTIIETVTGEQYKEQPAWAGADDISNFYLTHNQKTGTWSLIQYSDGIACILGTGSRSQFLYTDKPFI